MQHITSDQSRNPHQKYMKLDYHGANITVWPISGLIMPLIRRVYPKLLASQIVGVQPIFIKMIIKPHPWNLILRNGMGMFCTNNLMYKVPEPGDNYGN